MNHYIKIAIFILCILIIILVNYSSYNKEQIKIGPYILQFHYDYIDKNKLKTYVISLDRTPERYVNVKKQLDNIGLMHSRFNAVDGYDLVFSDRDSSATFKGKDIKDGNYTLNENHKYLVYCPSIEIEYNSDFNKLNRTLTAGEFGCYCSHIEIWNNIVKNNIEYALIFEDDVTLDKDFYQFFDKLTKKLPKGWDIIYLHVAHHPFKNLNKILFHDQLLKFGSDQLGVSLTSGYLISKKGAKKLKSYSRTFTFPIDDKISNAINKGFINAYKTKNLYVTAPNGAKPEDSTIHQMGRDHF